MVEYWQIAKKYEKDFLKDLRDLGIIPPTTFMRVSEFVPSIIKFIEKLVRDDFGYLADDGRMIFSLNLQMLD